MDLDKKPTFGLALSGSGNRSSFYIGFLEVLDEQNLKPDYITACSGGCLVAAAFACGTLPEFKEKIFCLTKENLKTYFVRSKGKGGLYSIDLLEEEMLHFTKGLSFEEVRPLMGFVSVDIETGQKVLLCMGDIARAARISCTVPGIFKPIKWGGKILVDGGLLTIVPGDFLRQANMDVTVGINMRGTKHIFTDQQINTKKVLNFLKKILFLEEIDSWVDGMFPIDELDLEQNPNFFEVVGKSLDLAILANKQDKSDDELCDLMIVPNVPTLKQDDFSPETIKFYYGIGRKTAEENLPKIRKLVDEKARKVREVV